jgi:chloramphenicol 3-O phosphotransferase
MSGIIIVINGTSSSGKTSIIRLLQERLEPPYLDMGVDRFIFMMPKRYLDRPLWDNVLGRADHAGDAGHTLISGMHHAVAAAARAGSNILVDHVLVEKQWVEECARLFADLPAYLIGLHCPLEILEERERSRKDRTLGQARVQWPVIHRHATYDLELDTSLLSPDECAERIIERMQTPPAAFRRLNPECYNPPDV